MGVILWWVCLGELVGLMGSDGEDEIGDFVCGLGEGDWRSCCVGCDVWSTGGGLMDLAGLMIWLWIVIMNI